MELSGAEIAAVFTGLTGAGTAVGWLARHFSNGSAPGNGERKHGPTRDEIRWQEEMRAMTKAIRDAVCEGNAELASSLDKVASGLEKLGALAHETHQRVSRIELHLIEGEAVRRERREARG